MISKNTLLAAVVGGVMVMGVSSASGASLLDDQFDDGVLGTNTTGVGTGFTVFQGFGSGGTAVESGGVVDLASNGTNIITHIQSNDTFNPTDLTLTWVINSSAGSTGFNGVGVGWIKPGETPFITLPGVELDLRADRLTFDLSDGGSGQTRQVGLAIGSVADPNATYNWDFNSTIVAEITLSATGWALNVTGTGVSVMQSGLYTDLGVGGLEYGATADARVTLADVLAGADSDLSTFASVVREPGGAEIESVTLVPEPTSLALLSLGGLLVASRRRRR